MTNGENILSAFSNATIRRCKNKDFTYIEVEQNDKWIADFDMEWWNAEYKEPTTKNDLPQTMEELFKYLTDKIPSWKVILIDKWTDFKVWLWIKTHKGADRWE